MEANVKQTVAKHKFLQPGGSARRVDNALDMIKQKTADREYIGERFFSKVGIWFFPVMVISLTTAGVGGLLNQFLPFNLGYVLAGVLAVLIEVAQAAFGRPLCKRLAKQQSTGFGMWARAGAFTLLSIGLGAVAFYFVFMESEKAALVDNSVKLASLKDSTLRAYNAKNAMLTAQLNDLNKAKKVRFKGLLMPEEQALQSTINRQLTVNDSLQKAELTALATSYPTEQKKLNWTFSPDMMVKIIGSLIVVLIIGFLTVYCHYIDYCYAKRIADESSNVLGHDGEFGLYDEVATIEAGNFYMERYAQMPGMELLALPGASQANIPYQIAAQTTQQPKASNQTPTSAPTARKIGFSIGEQIEKQEEKTDANENSVPLDENSVRVNENSVPQKQVILTGNRVCVHCGNQFVYQHKKHVYCSENCRRDAWQTKTGRKLKPISKGGQA
jgi:hypothetical protein